MKLRLVSSNLKSTSLKLLAQGLSSALGYKVFRGSTAKPGRNNLRYGDLKDKIYQYKWFKEQNIPALEFTTDYNAAEGWYLTGQTVVGRRLTCASEGKGIEIYGPGKPFDSSTNPCPVYTLYKKKKKEFRVHIFKDKVVHVLEKRKKAGWEGVRETKIRNTANGYVFCSDNVEEPAGLRELALAASKVTQSDFKGVDVAYNEKENALFVLEVNSAPGIQGTNIQRYIETIK